MSGAQAPAFQFANVISSSAVTAGMFYACIILLLAWSVVQENGSKGMSDWYKRYCIRDLLDDVGLEDWGTSLRESAPIIALFIDILYTVVYFLYMIIWKLVGNLLKWLWCQVASPFARAGGWLGIQLPDYCCKATGGIDAVDDFDDVLCGAAPSGGENVDGNKEQVPRQRRDVPEFVGGAKSWEEMSGGEAAARAFVGLGQAIFADSGEKDLRKVTGRVRP